MTTSLALVETMNPAEIFKPGTMDPIIDRIRDEVRAVKTDISTEAGRKEIASLAFKVAKSKTFIDGVRKRLTEDQKKALKLIDQEGGRIWDALEALQKEVRQPLTDWENAEKDRVAAHEANLKEIEAIGPYTLQNWQIPPLEAMRERITELRNEQINWEEFSRRSEVAKDVACKQIQEAIERREKHEAEQEELKRLRAAQVERERQEREERIAREAREQAEAEAKQREEHAKQVAETERQRIENEKFQAEARAKQAEAERLAAIEKAERDAREAAERAEQARIAAEKKAEADKLAAIETERKRVAEQERIAREEAQTRERNKKHVAKINKEAAAAIYRNCSDAPYCVNLAAADEIVAMIASGLIDNVKITY